MALTVQDTQFLEQMVAQLECTIHELSQREARLVLGLGAERVEELRELWEGRLSREDEQEVRRTLDWNDRELVWMWSRLRRARSSRAEAGKAIMRRFSTGA